jgi:hypothetical protein
LSEVEVVMRDEGFERAFAKVLDGVVELETRTDYSIEAVGRYVEVLYDALVTKSRGGGSNKGEVVELPHFMCNVGVGLYERHKYRMAIEVLTRAALAYESMHGQERAEGRYRCYGNITYCYRALGDRASEKDFTLKTLESERQVKIFRDEEVTPDLLEGRDRDFCWTKDT